MLSFLLGLLKIIGIVLLILLLTIAVIVTVVLFVPIRYQGRGELNTEKKTAQLKATWLLKIVCFQLDYIYPDKPIICFRIMGADIMKLLNRTPGNAEKAKKKAVDLSKQAIEDTSEIQPAIEAMEETAEDAENVCTEMVIENNESAQSKEIKEKETLRDKIKKIIFKIKSLYDRIRSVLCNIQYYIDIWQEEDTQALLKNAKNSLLKIWKSICPQEFLLTGVFGFDTPDTTGKTYGYYCMAMPWIGEYIKLAPDFESKRLEGDVYLRGRITIFVILVNGLRVLFDKRLKPLIKKLKHGGMQNGR